MVKIILSCSLTAFAFIPHSANAQSSLLDEISRRTDIFYQDLSGSSEPCIGIGKGSLLSHREKCISSVLEDNPSRFRRIRSEADHIFQLYKQYFQQYEAVSNRQKNVISHQKRAAYALMLTAGDYCAAANFASSDARDKSWQRINVQEARSFLESYIWAERKCSSHERSWGEKYDAVQRLIGLHETHFANAGGNNRLFSSYNGCPIKRGSSGRVVTEWFRLLTATCVGIDEECVRGWLASDGLERKGWGYWRELSKKATLTSVTSRKNITGLPARFSEEYIELVKSPTQDCRWR